LKSKYASCLFKTLIAGSTLRFKQKPRSEHYKKYNCAVLTKQYMLIRYILLVTKNTACRTAIQSVREERDGRRPVIIQYDICTRCALKRKGGFMNKNLYQFFNLLRFTISRPAFFRGAAYCHVFYFRSCSQAPSLNHFCIIIWSSPLPLRLFRTLSRKLRKRGSFAGTAIPIGSNVRGFVATIPLSL